MWPKRKSVAWKFSRRIKIDIEEDLRARFIRDDMPKIHGLSDFRLLAKGGQGIVFSAKASPNDQMVVVKLISNLNDDTVHRFHQEIQIQSQLATHTNIARIIRHGECTYGEKALPFFVAEFFQGVTLQEKLQVGNIDLDASILIIRQIADALKHCHRMNIIHRDITPSNVLVNEEGLVQLIDFGISFRVGDQAFTEDAPVYGTFPYAAPEVIKGGLSTARSDVYSCGILFEKLLDSGSLKNSKKVDCLNALVRNATKLDPLDRFSDMRKFLHAIKLAESGEFWWMQEVNDRKYLKWAIAFAVCLVLFISIMHFALGLGEQASIISGILLAMLLTVVGWIHIVKEFFLQ